MIVGISMHMEVDQMGHALVDAQGEKCIEIRLSAENRHDITQATSTIAHHRTEAMLGDKWYDPAWFRRWLRNHRICAVIPGKTNRIRPFAMTARFTKTVTV